jgi:hypothetical protein
LLTILPARDIYVPDRTLLHLGKQTASGLGPARPVQIAVNIVDEPQAAHCEPWFNEQAESSLELGQRFRPVSMTDSFVT